MKLRCEDLCALESLLKSDAARATARRSSSYALDCLLVLGPGNPFCGFLEAVTLVRRTPDQISN